MTIGTNMTLMKFMGITKRRSKMKKNFRFEDYPINCAMHCKTKEEAIEFCKLMHEDGRKWASGESYEEENCWETDKQHTCYAFNYGLFCNKEYYIDNGYLVLEWSDFIQDPREIIVYKLSGYDVEVALEEMRVKYTEEQLYAMVTYINRRSLDIPYGEYMSPMIEMAIEEGVMGNVPYNPEEGDKYYYPCFDMYCLYRDTKWGSSEKEENIKTAVGVYRTKEEAIAKAKELWGLGN